MKIRVSLYTILFASLLGSCDNFLDIPSETSLSSEVYYKSQSDFEQGIMVRMLCYEIYIVEVMEHGQWVN